MTNYRNFPKKEIGSSDIASLTVRTPGKVGTVNFGEDGYYHAYICVGNDVEIGSHYTKVFSGSEWLWIYDDFKKSYSESRPGMHFDIYTAGDFGCIIHWHD